MPAAIPTRSPSQSRLGRWPTLCTVFSMLHFADIVRQSQACAASWCLAVRLFQVAAVVVVSLSVGLFPLYQPAPVSDPLPPPCRGAGLPPVSVSAHCVGLLPPRSICAFLRPAPSLFTHQAAGRESGTLPIGSTLSQQHSESAALRVDSTLSWQHSAASLRIPSRPHSKSAALALRVDSTRSLPHCNQSSAGPQCSLCVTSSLSRPHRR